MVAQPGNSKGFSLIELMVVVAIIGLLAVVASPYTGTWITSSQVQTAKGNLVQAHARAKAAGLRGQGGVLTWELNEDDSKVHIFACSGSNNECNKSSAGLLWMAKTDPGIEVQLTRKKDDDSTTTPVGSPIKYDSRSRIHDKDGKLIISPIFEIKKGGADDTFILQ